MPAAAPDDRGSIRRPVPSGAMADQSHVDGDGAPTGERRPSGDVESLDYGPSGYLPERASKRARKIVLRAPLGLQWVIGSVVAGLVLLVAVIIYLQVASSPPGEPWVAMGAVTDVGDASFDDEHGVLLVGAGGRVRAFVDADDVDYCPASNRLEASDGRVWSLTGRGRGGVTSLDEHPTMVHERTLYVDVSRVVPGPSASDEPVEPACAGEAPASHP